MNSRRARLNTVTLVCLCEAVLRVTLGCPGEIEEIEELTSGKNPDLPGCQHGETDTGYQTWLYDRVAEADQEASEAAYDREMDARIERERERVQDWERYPDSPAHWEEGGEQ